MTHESDLDRSIGSMMRDLNVLDVNAFYHRYGCTHQKAVVDLIRTRELDYPSGERCQQMLAYVMSRPIEEQGHLDLVALLHLSGTHAHSAIREWVRPESIMRHVSQHIWASARERGGFTHQHALQAYTLFEACAQHPSAGLLLSWYPDSCHDHPLAILDEACWDSGSAYLMQRVIRNSQAVPDSTRHFIIAKLHQHLKHHIKEQQMALVGKNLSKVEVIDYEGGDISTVLGKYESHAGREFMVSMDINWGVGQANASESSAGMPQIEEGHATSLLQQVVAQISAVSGIRVIFANRHDEEPDLLAGQELNSQGGELRN